MVQQYAIVLAFKAGDTESSNVVGPKWFRPGKFYTNVTGPDIAKIDGLYIGNDPENQFCGVGAHDIDAWEFSVHNVEKQRQAFLVEHGLVGKTDAQIQDYLDENELCMPDVPHLELPTLRTAERIRVTGNFPVEAAITFLGFVP